MSSAKIIKENTYSVLKKRRNVIEKKLLNAIKQIGTPDPKRVAKQIVGKSVKPVFLGKGEYGAVVSFAIDRKRFAVKEARTLKHEYEMMKMLHIKHLNVPKPYYIHKKGNDILAFEYASGGTVESYLKNVFNKNSEKFSRDTVRNIVTQVITTVYKLQQMDSTFRHNDMHLQNVLIEKCGKKTGYSTIKLGKLTVLKKNMGTLTLLHDLAFSNCLALPNKEVNAGKFREYGIMKYSNPIYDVHFFLNSLNSAFYGKAGFKETADMFRDLFPFEYRMADSSKVIGYRLRGNINHDKILPSITKVLQHPYFKRADPKTLAKQVANENAIQARMCMRLKKAELVCAAKTLGFNTEKKTKLQLCEAMKSRFKGRNKVYEVL